MRDFSKSLMVGNAGYLTKEAIKKGDYKETSLDQSKKNASFLIQDIDAKKATIRWKSGKVEVVTIKKLDELKKQNPNWIMDL